MSIQDDFKNRTLSIEKEFKAPLQLVWDAWTQSDHISKWWAPPGMAVAIEKHDFKVGGAWKYCMDMPNGSKFISEGVYSEIIAQEKIVTSADFKPMTEGVILETHFSETDGKTKIIFNCIHPSEAYCKQQEEMGFYNGWGGTFNRLETFLTTAG